MDFRFRGSVPRPYTWLQTGRVAATSQKEDDQELNDYCRDVDAWMSQTAREHRVVLCLISFISFVCVFCRCWGNERCLFLPPFTTRVISVENHIKCREQMWLIKTLNFLGSVIVVASGLYNSRTVYSYMERDGKLGKEWSHSVNTTGA